MYETCTLSQRPITATLNSMNCTPDMKVMRVTTVFPGEHTVVYGLSIETVTFRIVPDDSIAHCTVFRKPIAGKFV